MPCDKTFRAGIPVPSCSKCIHAQTKCTFSRTLKTAAPPNKRSFMLHKIPLYVRHSSPPPTSCLSFYSFFFSMPKKCRKTKCRHTDWAQHFSPSPPTAVLHPQSRSSLRWLSILFQNYWKSQIFSIPTDDWDKLVM